MAPPQPQPPQPIEAELLALIRAHGSAIMAYSKLQPGLEHFYVPGLGAVSFCVMQVGPPFLFKNRPAVLGDPLCAPHDRERLTRLFLSKHPRSFFVQVSRDYALLLQKCFGLKATCMGGETELDVAGGYDLTGTAKHPLRHAAAAAEREGVWVEELASSSSSVVSSAAAVEANNDNSNDNNCRPWPPLSALSPVSPRLESDEVQRGLKAVDAAWATTKGAHHAARIWFINRAPVFEAEPGVRKFVAWQRRPSPPASGGEGEQEEEGNGSGNGNGGKDTSSDREMVAYIFFDPVYRDGRACGVYANVTRIAPDAPPGCLNLIMREALKKFKSELERERELEAAAAAAAALAERKRKEAAADNNDDDDDCADDLARDQQDHQQQAPQQPEQKLTRKERLALKAAALAARGVSDEELRAQRAAARKAASATGASKKKQPTQQQLQPSKPATTTLASSITNTTTNNNNNNLLPPFFVSLGMAPFFALCGGSAGHSQDPDIPGERSATRVMEWVYEHGQTFYPYKAIAFSKTRYGGGLDEATWTFPRDRAARWRPVYAASSLDAPTFVALFDLGALVGFWKGPFNAIATFVRYEWSGLRTRLAARMGSSSSSRRRGGAGGTEEAAATTTTTPPVPAHPPTPAVAPAALAVPPSPSFASAASTPGSVADAFASFEDGAASPAGAKGRAPAALAPRVGGVAAY